MTHSLPKSVKLLLVAGALASVPGCGSAAVSTELVDARRQVARARGSIAAELEPDELRVAERRLAASEAAEDGSLDERHFAYLADRQARLAITNATTAQVQRQAELERDQYQEQLERTAESQQQALEAREDALAAFQAELANVRVQLSAQGEVLNDRTAELQAREAELNTRIAELMAEREARAAAEERAAQAMARLREMAEVREEQDQWIITLNGEVLFETDQATLRSTAAARLTAVAEALANDPDSSIVIEGHTDSRGSDSYNARLSQERAAAVRAFLIRRGLSGDRMNVVGRGEAEPVADNGTPEGRANNRRVEIIVQRNS